MGMTWVEDPSNADRAALRPRLRLLRRDSAGAGSATAALVAAASEAGRQRAEQDLAVAAELAKRASVRPEGFALLDGPVSGGALAALVQTIGGAPFPPATQSVARLAPALAPATLAGVRLLRAGRLGAGWLVVREANAMAAPVAALAGAIWDGRFRLGAGFRAPAGATLGPVGADAARLRRFSSLPAAILRTLPAIRVASVLLAVPHLHYPDRKACEGIPVVFAPSRPAAAAAYRFGDASWAETPYVG
jgi:tRNA(Ile)-lysidine synthase